jgi:hypothetical protein
VIAAMGRPTCWWRFGVILAGFVSVSILQPMRTDPTPAPVCPKTNGKPKAPLRSHVLEKCGFYHDIGEICQKTFEMKKIFKGFF